MIAKVERMAKTTDTKQALGAGMRHCETSKYSERTHNCEKNLIYKYGSGKQCQHCVLLPIASETKAQKLHAVDVCTCSNMFHARPQG
eukprot:6035756-Amphidinium_carterae.1